jgi:hypothetical protein
MVRVKEKEKFKIREASSSETEKNVSPKKGKKRIKDPLSYEYPKSRTRLPKGVIIIEEYEKGSTIRNPLSYPYLISRMKELSGYTVIIKKKNGEKEILNIPEC